MPQHQLPPSAQLRTLQRAWALIRHFATLDHAVDAQHGRSSRTEAECAAHRRQGLFSPCHDGAHCGQAGSTCSPSESIATTSTPFVSRFSVRVIDCCVDIGLLCT
eukprot:TRINITY_DN5219_c0_g1_i3.p2 TRINITY_DN5219_c0_g1~~TRINITY_DN5219_c0_g1_i3.p2  ORF type:complete len:105 (-),score=0.19 TRINITY_DN5219_c0_g1_i3:35-349(-)